jgi:hypothetical protein
MKAFLKKLKLIRNFTIELEMDKNEFVERLSKIVDEGSTSSFASSFEVFSSSKNEYKGTVGYDSFEIRKKRKFFDKTMSLAVVKGTLTQQRKKLIIDAEANTFNGMMVFYFIFLIIIYLIFIAGFIILSVTGSGFPFIAIPFIIIHAGLMFFVPYFLMRKSLKHIESILEKDFFYLTKAQNNEII